MDSKTVVRMRAVAELRGYNANARTHSPAQVREIAASIERFKWTNPILVDETGMILAGHGRLAAAELLGLAKVPTIEVSGLDEAQKRALILADNKIALNASWDVETLRVELVELDEAEFDLDLTGFSSVEIEEIFGEKPKGLAERFGGFVPFTVFDASKPDWVAMEERDRQELGQDEDFSPTAVRMMLRLYCPAEGRVVVAGNDKRVAQTVKHLGYKAVAKGAQCLVGLRPFQALLVTDRKAYRDSLVQACKALAEDAFACVVVDDVTGSKGVVDAMRETLEAFNSAGLNYQNEAVIVWGAPVRDALRARMPRKHSMVLVFSKGDVGAAADAVSDSYPQEERNA